MTHTIKSVIKTSFLDWRGKISTVLFLGGCNFRCPYCHNKDLVLYPQNINNIPLNNVINIILHNHGWVDGIVITGGEPTLNPHYLTHLTHTLRKTGLPIKLDTNGSHPAILEYLIENSLIDYVAMDFKAPLRDDAYALCSGIHHPPLPKIKQSIHTLLKHKIDYEFRITVCPTLLSTNDILSMAQSIDGAKKLTLQNFRPHNTLNPSFETIPPYSKTRLNNLRKITLPYVQECTIVAPQPINKEIP